MYIRIYMYMYRTNINFTDASYFFPKWGKKRIKEASWIFPGTITRHAVFLQFDLIFSMLGDNFAR